MGLGGLFASIIGYYCATSIINNTQKLDPGSITISIEDEVYRESMVTCEGYKEGIEEEELQNIQCPLNMNDGISL
jgi:hypothetical protein